MVSFVTFTSVFLAAITLISCAIIKQSEFVDPTQQQAPEVFDGTQLSASKVFDGTQLPASEDFDSTQPLRPSGFQLDITEVIRSLVQLPTEQAQKLAKPLKNLANNLHDTIFGSLFSYMWNQLQNPSQSVSVLENMKEFEKEVSTDTVVADILRLPEEVIAKSRPEFEKITKILSGSEAAKMFEEIGSVLNMRSGLGLDEYTQMDAIPSTVVTVKQRSKNQPPSTATTGQPSNAEIMKTLTAQIGTKIKANKAKDSLQPKARKAPQPIPQPILTAESVGSMTV